MFVCLYLCLSVALVCASFDFYYVLATMGWAVGGGREGGPREGLMAIKNPRFICLSLLLLFGLHPK